MSTAEKKGVKIHLANDFVCGKYLGFNISVILFVIIL